MKLSILTTLYRSAATVDEFYRRSMTYNDLSPAARRAAELEARRT